MNPLLPGDARVMADTAESGPAAPREQESPALRLHSFSEHRRRVRRVWIVTLSVMAVTLGATLIVSYFAQLSYQQSEQRLTNLQTSLTGQVLSGATLQTSSQLDRVAGLSAESSDPVTTFKTAMAPLMKPKGPYSSASLVFIGQSPVILQHLGMASLHSPTSKRSSSIYERAARSSSEVVTRAVSGSQQRFGFLVSAKGSAGTYVVAAGSQLPSNRHVTLPAKSPNAVLNFALYYGTKATSASLIETNAQHLPLSGPVATQMVPFGTAHLTLVASPRVSLAGAWPAYLPWAILILGIILALAVGRFARHLAQRRSEAEEGAETAQRLYAEERSLSRELQVALLPKSLPAIDGVEFCAKYLPATSGLEVGGDWYSAISIDNDRFAFVVGDVSGHGMSAASAMAPLRFTVRALAKLGMSPAAILEQADTEIDLVNDGHFATVLVGIVDRSQNICTLASAGHPLPLVMTGGGCDQLDLPVCPPLGVHLGPFTEHRVMLPPAATLVAFTDGLVERRVESIESRIARLRHLLGSLERPTAEAAVGLALGMLDERGEHEDDIAIIAIRLSIAAQPELDDVKLTKDDRLFVAPTASPAITSSEA